MRLWKRATGALKDRYCIWVAKLSPHGPCRNPNLETVIIRATSHDDQCMDYKSVHKVFQWLRNSPLYLKPLLYTLSMRMEKTHSWVVALKGLMLVHGVFCFDLPAVQRMGRLPFDLSRFSDGHLSPEMAWGYNAFVRAYYSYLDQKSSYVCSEAKKASRQQGRKKKAEETLVEELESLERLQGLIDMIIQVKPKHQHMNVVLVLEAMDCVIDEVLEVYEKVCKGIDRVMSRICDIGGKMEAEIGVGILRKAEVQGDKLSSYLDFAKDIGVLNSTDHPKIMRIPEKDMHELRRIMNGASEKKKSLNHDDNNNNNNNDDDSVIVKYEDKAILVEGCTTTVAAAADLSEQMESEKGLKTVITDQWEVFDDEAVVVDDIAATNPFVECYSLVPYNPVHDNHHYVLPDLISL